MSKPKVSYDALKLVFCFFIGVVLWYSGVPEGMNPKGWHLFSIFIPTIMGLILRPLPMGAIALLGLLVSVLTGVLDLGKEGLTAYSSEVVWLVVFVFFIARGIIKTHLGMRVAYFFISLVGGRSLGLAYGLAATELMIAPFVPSNTARAGGIVFPILKSIADTVGSRVDNGRQRDLGAYLTLVVAHINIVASAMFLTAMAANPMVQSIGRSMGVTITWMSWFLGALVPGVVSVVMIPLIIYWIYPPKLKVLTETKAMAKKHLATMAPMSSKEWTMIGVFFLMLLCWIKGGEWGISSTATGLLGLGLLLVTKVITWEDILNEKEAWHTLIWMSILVAMAGYLQSFGFVGWFSQKVQVMIGDYNPWVAYMLLIGIYFYSHYFFASNTAHIGAMYAGFLAVAIAIGIPPMIAAISLGYISNLFACLTHYGTPACVVLYSGGYVPVQAWWGVGFVMSLFHIAVWVGLGSIWWQLLGYY